MSQMAKKQKNKSYMFKKRRKLPEPMHQDLDTPESISQEINENTNVNDVEPVERVVEPVPPVKQQSIDPPPTQKRAEIKNPFGALTPIAYRLVIWEKPVDSGIVLGGSLAFLIFTSLFSAFNGFCAAAMFIIGASTGYVFVMKQYNRFKQEDTHPFAKYLDNPPELSREFIDRYYDVGVDGVNYIAQEGTKIVLAEDTSRSLKYALGFFVLWTLGSWFSFVTLLGIALVLGFTLPIGYQKNKTVVDEKYEQAAAFARAHTDQGLELARKYCGDMFAKGKDLAASKLAKGEAEKKKE